MTRPDPLPTVRLVEIGRHHGAELTGHTAYPGGTRSMSPDMVGNSILIATRICDCKRCDACLVAAAVFGR